MKITESISDLVIELSELETPSSAKKVLGSNGLSLKHLIDIYSESDNRRSREVVLEIIDEVGGAWGPQLSDSAQAAEEADALNKNAANGYTQLSEDDFMDLLPVNCYMH